MLCISRQFSFGNCYTYQPFNNKLDRNLSRHILKAYHNWHSRHRNAERISLGKELKFMTDKIPFSILICNINDNINSAFEYCMIKLLLPMCIF